MKTSRELVVLGVSGCAIITCIGTLVTVGAVFYLNKSPHDSAELPRKRDALEPQDAVAQEKARIEVEVRRQKEETEQQEANRRAQASIAMAFAIAEINLISNEESKSINAEDFETFVTYLHNSYIRTSGVDTIECPKDFRDTYADYCKALDSTYDAASKIPSDGSKVVDSIGKMLIEKKWQPGIVDQTLKALDGAADEFEDGDFKNALRSLEKAEVQLNLVFRRNIAMREKPSEITIKACRWALTKYPREYFPKQYPIAKALLAGALNDVAWRYLTSDVVAERDFKKALPLAQESTELNERSNAATMDTFALALFENGRPRDAVEAEEKAVALLPSDDKPEHRKGYTDSLARFRAALK